MPNELTPHSMPSAHILLTTPFPEVINSELRKRVPSDQLGRVLRDLLKNYWRPDETPTEQIRHVALMVQDLERFPAAVLSWTLREWRTGSTRRPSTADLFQLANKRLRDIEARRDYLHEQKRLAAQPAPVEITDEERDERRLRTERIMAEAGFRMRAGRYLTQSEIDETENRPRVPHWSETAAPDDPRWHALRAARATTAETEAQRRRETGQTREADHRESDPPDWDQRTPPPREYEGETREGRA